MALALSTALAHTALGMTAVTLHVAHAARRVRAWGCAQADAAVEIGVRRKVREALR